MTISPSHPFAVSCPAAVLFAILIGLAGWGCSAPDIRAEDAPYIVDEVVLEGVSVFKKDQLLDYLHAGETSFWWGKTYYYSDALGRVDAARIVELYAAFGYREAKVLTATVRPIDKSDATDEPREARVRFEVVEGEPTLLKAVDFEWPKGRDLALAEAIEPEGRLKLDAPFRIEDFNRAHIDYKLALQSKGYPLAEVEKTAWVTPEQRRAEVRFTLTPGRQARIGAVDFTGLGAIPEDLVRREVEDLSGRRYAPQTLKQAEGRVFSMDVFRSVTAVPADHVNDDGTLDLKIHTAALPPQSLKVGVGFGFEPTRWEERVSFRYTHRNLFGRLYRLDLNAKVGWAQLPFPWDVQAHGPVLEIQPTFKKKGLLEKNLVWLFAPDFKVGIEQGFQFYSTSGRLGVSRWFLSRTLAELEYRLTYFNFFNRQSEFENNRTQLGRDFRDPYLLSLVEGKYSVFFTDSLLDPKNGVVLTLRYGVAGGAFAGDYDFQRIVPEVRGYWAITGSTHLVARSRMGWILTYGDQPGAPILEKFALGGADSIRGWGLRRLSPQIRDCPDEDCRGIPVGGSRMHLTNVELRQEIIPDLYLAAFLDVADVANEAFVTDPGDWHYTSGGGFRYATPIGRLRVDFGYRLSAPNGYPDEPMWALHLALGEAF